MSLNCNEIDLILSELDLAGGFVQEVVQPNFNSVAIYTYKPGVPKTVFISLAAGECRICETRRKITKNEKPLRFNEMLKSKIKGARILSCTQIEKERIIKMELEKAGAIYVMPQAQEHAAKKAKSLQTDDEDDFFTLYIRLWSNAGNIFLCDKDDVILDSFYRRPAKGEKTGEKLELPEKKSLSEDELRALNEKFQVREFAELTAEYAAKNPEYPDLTFNQKVDLYYSENAAATSLESLLEQAEKWYESHRSKLASSLERLKEKRESFRNAGQYKHQGDLILAYGYQIDGKSNFLECEDFETGKKISIKIDPKKSAQENAASYYDTYKKQTSGMENLDFDIESAEKELAALEKQYNEIVAEKNPIKLEQVLRKTQKPKQQEKKSHPGLDFLIDGWQIIVGRDATENDELLRHTVKGADMWLHVRDYHGGYVFIKNRPGKTVPLEILLAAGNLAVYFSKARKNGSADLYYTQVKHLRRAKNAPKGTVLPTNEKNLFIKLDDAKIRKILAGVADGD
ncbi:MAG: NFACT family protein [Treponema sp.]|uniref:NFACT family protein n=1 Tax=Treponema sp. TaxID=166 RepID=UPI0025F46F15|nr:NFACT family protein [Treponema sp.]MBR0494644.1 NFACT family protein [Treponema sp.]